MHVALDRRRNVGPLAGVRIHYVVRFDEVALLHLSPPRLRIEHALLDVAASDSEAAAIAVLGDACQDRRTTPERLRQALARRVRLRHRELLGLVLDDVAAGAFSVLEHRYLTRVERPHGLPTAARQRRVVAGGRAAYRDVEYVDLATVVELDGRLGHDRATDRWADGNRGLATARTGGLTLRFGWGHVLEPCRTAQGGGGRAGLAGLSGTPRACGPLCRGFPASGARDPRQMAAETVSTSWNPGARCRRTSITLGLWVCWGVIGTRLR